MSNPEFLNQIFSTPAIRQLEPLIDSGSGFVVVDRPPLRVLSPDDRPTLRTLPRSSHYELTFVDPDYDISALNDRFAALRNGLSTFDAYVHKARYDEVNHPRLPDFVPAQLMIREYIGTLATDNTVKLDDDVTWRKEWSESISQFVLEHKLTVRLHPSKEFAHRSMRSFERVDLQFAGRRIRKQLRKSQGHEAQDFRNGFSKGVKPEPTHA